MLKRFESKTVCLIGLNINLCVPFGKMMKLHYGYQFSEKFQIDMESEINIDSSGKALKQLSPKFFTKTFSLKPVSNIYPKWGLPSLQCMRLLGYKLLFSKRR